MHRLGVVTGEIRTRQALVGAFIGSREPMVRHDARDQASCDQT
jgi:hypothetical protein